MAIVSLIFKFNEECYWIFRPEKPDELPDADDSGPKDDDNEIDVNKIDEEMFNKVLKNISTKLWQKNF